MSCETSFVGNCALGGGEEAFGGCCPNARHAALSNSATDSGAQDAHQDAHQNTDLVANRVGAPALRTDLVISPSTGSEALRTAVTRKRRSHENADYKRRR